jgi:hypothetical protein
MHTLSVRVDMRRGLLAPGAISPIPLPPTAPSLPTLRLTVTSYSPLPLGLTVTFLFYTSPTFAACPTMASARTQRLHLHAVCPDSLPSLHWSTCGEPCGMLTRALAPLHASPTPHRSACEHTHAPLKCRRTTPFTPPPRLPHSESITRRWSRRGPCPESGTVVSGCQPSLPPPLYPQAYLQ